MFGVGNPTFTNYFLGFGPTPGMLGVGNPFSEKMIQTHLLFHGLGAAGIQNTMKRMKRMKATWETIGSSDPRFLTRLRPG